MSRSIDERVVSMQFDNANFEKNVSQSMSTLDKLKQSLRLDDASDGMSGLGSAAETAKMKFSAMQVVAVTALANITNSAINTGKQLISSLSIDQITAGWQKFSDKTTSVATLVAQGNALEDVNDQLDRLNWFTDETSYNFTDMVSNISKFTATGQDLEASVTAMEGIATWAALSGQNASTASRAMYQLSQAMGAGYMRLEDYKSIQNASMDTEEFRQKTLDAAVSLGTLKKNSDGTYQSTVKGAKKTKFTLSEFTTSLTTGMWMTSDVMMEVFNTYSGAVEGIYDAAEEKGMLASEIIDEIYDTAEEKSISTDEAIKLLGYDFDSFALKAFEAAQKARTFNDAIDSVKDAVSTGWMNTFEIIFGDAEEATEFWTDLANSLWDVFAAGGEARNEMLKGWKELGGRDDLIESFWNVWEGIASIVTPIKEAFRDIFPAMTAERLAKITSALKEFTAKLKLSDETAAKVKSTFKGLFAVLDIVWSTFKTLAKGALKIVGAFKGLVTGVLGSSASLGDFLSNLRDSIKETNFLGKAVDTVTGFITKAIDKIKEFVQALRSGSDDSRFSGLITFFKTVWSLVTKVGKAIISTLGELGNSLAEALGKGDIFEVINSILTSGILLGITKIANGVGGTLKSLRWILEEVYDVLLSYSLKIKAEALLKVAIAIGILAISLTVLSGLDSDALSKAVAALGMLFAELVAAMYLMSKFSSSGGVLSNLLNAKTLKKTASAMVPLATAVLLLAMAMKQVGGLDWEGVAKGLVSVAALVGILVAAAKIMDTEYKTITKFAGQMLIMSAAIWVLSRAAKSFASLSWEGLTKAGLGITGAVVLLVAAAKIMDSEYKKITKFAGQMLIMSAAIGVLALVAKTFASLSWEGLAKAGLGITGAVVLLVAAAKIMDNEYKKITKFAGQMLIMSAAIGIMSLAAKSFASMSWEGLAKACVGLTVAVGLLVAAAKIMDSDYKSITKFAGQMLIMSVGIAILAASMKKIGNMSWEQIAKGLITLAGAFAIIGVAGLLLKPLIGTILALSAAFVLFGIGMVGIGAGITLIAVGISMLATALSVGATAIVAALTVIITGILNLVPTIIQIIGKTIVGIATVIGEQAPVLAESCLKLVSSVLKSLAEHAPEITESIAEILIGVMNGLSVHMPALIEALVNLLASVFEGLGQALKNLELGSLRDGIDAAIGLSALMVAMAAALKIAGGINIGKALKGALALTTMAVPLAAFALVLSCMDGITNARDNAIGLAALIAACALMMVPLTLVGAFWEAALIGVGALTAMVVPMLAFVGVLAVMDCVPNAEANAKLLTDLMTTMGDLLFKIALVAPLAALGVTAMAGLTALIGAVAVMAVAMGALMDKFPSLERFLDKGLPLLEKLAGSMGSMIGKFIGGIGEALSGSLVKIGANIAAFMTTLSTASTIASTIKSESFDGVEKLMKVMLEIGGTSIATGFMDKINGLFNFGEDSMVTFKKNGVAFFKAMKAIGEASNDVDLDADVFDDVMTAAERLAELQSSLEPIGGVVSWFTGRDDLGTFGINAAIFIGSMLTAFAPLAVVKDLNTEAMDAVIDAAERLADLQSSLEPIGGVVSWFTGRDDLATFGTSVALFIGSMLTAFAPLAVVKDLNTEAMNAIIDAAQKLSDLQNNLDNIGGVITWFTGTDDLATFGVSVALFVKSMLTAFAPLALVKDLNTEAMNAIIDAAQKLSDLQKNLENIGGVISWFTGRDDLATFGVNVAVFVNSMLTAFAPLALVKDLNTEAMDAIIDAAQKLSELQKNLGNIGGVISWFTGTDDLATFGTSVALFINSMLVAFAPLALVKDLNTEAMNAIIDAAGALAGLQSKLEPIGGVVQWFSGRKDLADFGANIALFGEAMGKLKTGMGENGISEDVVTSITNAGNAIIELQKALPEEHWFDGKMNLSEFSDYVTDFAEAMATFGSKASEIDADAVSTVISTAYRIKSLIGSLVGLDTSGVKEFTGIGTGGIGADGPAYKIAQAMSAYSEEVAGIDTAAVSISVSAAKTLRNLINGLVDLDSSGVENFKPDAIGTKMKGYADKVAGIDTATVSSSISAANKLRGFISSLASLDSSGVANFKPDSIGTAIKTYAGSVSGINTQAISNSISAATKLRNFIASLVGLDTSGVASFKKAVNDLSTVNVSGMMQTFSDASTKLSSAGAEMIKSLADGMNSKKSSVEKVATSIASSTIDKIESKVSGFTKAGKSMASKLAEGLKDGKKSAEAAGSALATAAKDGIRSKYDSFYDAGSYLVTGFKNGISENSYQATAKATAMAEAAIKAARKALKINSPSKVFKEIGSGIPEGFAMGINTLGNSVDNSVDAMASTAINSARSAMATVLEAMSGDMDAQPTIRPVVDLSNVKTGVDAIGGLFASTQSVGVQSNLGAINVAMNRRLQNGANDDIISAINKLGNGLENNRGDTYNIDGITYSNGNEISEAVQTLVRAAQVGRRV